MLVELVIGDRSPKKVLSLYYFSKTPIFSPDVKVAVVDPLLLVWPPIG
jgi:hypothetical protein